MLDTALNWTRPGMHYSEAGQASRAGDKERAEKTSLLNKSLAILEALDRLRRRLGSRAFNILDYWPDDPNTIEIAHRAVTSRASVS